MSFAAALASAADLAPARARPPSLATVWARTGAYLELSKPRITLLALFTTLVGFALATRGAPDLGRLVHVLAATALVGAGANALNQLLERDPDGLMERTRRRPLPAGRLDPAGARVFAVDTAALGVIWLAALGARTASVLALLAIAAYVLIYTPLKRRTPWCTLAGAVPGALPPVIGWTAAAAGAGAAGGAPAGAGGPAGAIALFAILFLWQLPHFFALGWLLRRDYARGGFPMLPVLDRDGRATARSILASTALLLAASLLPVLIGLAGPLYAAGATLLGIALLALAADFARSRGDAAARLLFRGTLAYLPLLLALLLIDRAPL